MLGIKQKQQFTIKQSGVDDRIAQNRATPGVRSEIEQKADFSLLRYAQCWEDADVLLAAARIKSSDNVLSICSAGDNTLALLAAGPASVTAIDLSAAQLACLELRVAAFASLEYEEMLDLLGSSSNRPARLALYKRCRGRLSPGARYYWDRHLADIARGATSSGKFEHYFSLFRKFILPLAHSRQRVDQLLSAKKHLQRRDFFAITWNSWRWRLLFSLFFNRFVMGLLGRDRAFFQHVAGEISTSQTLAVHTSRALTELEPADNPYLHWILTGQYGNRLPFYLRHDNFARIKANLHRLSWQQCSLEEFLDGPGSTRDLDVFNLSDIFEYVSSERYEQLLKAIVRRARPGARLIYWNMLVSRSRPQSLAQSISQNEPLAQRLFQRNQTFFYKRLLIEEVI